jgi:single-stranded-DNA-specific exonuclease
MNEGKIHGINADTVPEDVKMVICPDSSSNSYEDHKKLRERGCDVLVLDHHLAERESADAIIINNQMCDYPNKTLSGVGIVYKFCSYLDSLLGTEYAKEILDLTAVGIIADMMDLRNFETHYIITQGL